MEQSRFDRLVRLLFVLLGAVDIAVGAAFAFGAGYFGFDRTVAALAGGIFVVMGLGMLGFVLLRGRSEPG